MTVRRAGSRLLGTMIVGLTLIVSGCTAGSPDGHALPPPAAPPPTSHAGPLPSYCTSTVTDSEQATSAVARLRPGNTMCLSGDRLTGAELAVTTSGTPEQPITITADGASLRSINIKADYVVIQGVTLKDGDGLTMEGRGLMARNNLVYNATMDGIACVTCIDTTIESNTVQRSDGTGIWFSGERVTVRNNTVSESILRTGGDADGIRFFGNGHRLTGNTIKDIKASGYGDDPRGGPHTDCFQTFNTASNPPTYDVVIADNVCTNVDVQCLIATANERGAQSTPTGQTAITFERNTCQVNGSQAVLLENFPRVIVRGNHFSGPSSRAVQLNRGSTDCAVIDNTVTGRMLPYQIDQQSRPGLQESGNTTS
ncbi:MAG: hypothetical protein DLM61_13590 [Pseudonocardiales bacterium]|nr:MAG: hypothetical protein DLM61_13590 [Pseudonocardiales bacterium]